MIEIQLFMCIHKVEEVEFEYKFFFIIRLIYLSGYRLWQLQYSLNRSVMVFHYFYVYYDGETYYHELHGLSYQDSN